MINALLGAIATEGGVYPNAWNKFVPRPIYMPPHPEMWNETTWPREYPLSMNEMSFLLPHLLLEGRAKVDVYFTRVYNPVWTNPDGFSWIEMLTDPNWPMLLAEMLGPRYGWEDLEEKEETPETVEPAIAPGTKILAEPTGDDDALIPPPPRPPQ